MKLNDFRSAVTLVISAMVEISIGIRVQLNLNKALFPELVISKDSPIDFSTVNGPFLFKIGLVGCIQLLDSM